MSGINEDDIPQVERKTVTDFCYLLDKSKQLFNGLRDLPQYGQKQWQSYFGRTFDVYTKLWKFQQQHRQVLDNRYGLKRWQIGEIASKIGQLYYHYYLRTSETSYLNEAFSFYSAIRQRSYYSQVTKEDRPELVVKKLRYYARFIVVCLLLNKMDVVKDLVKELSDEIEDYTHRFNTEDQLEWNLVLQEVAAFIEADPVMVLNDDNTIVIISNRLSEGAGPMLEQGMVVGQLMLADALIIGNCNNQVKFSELTIDMFRMLQALEREPMNLTSQMNKPGLQDPAEKPMKRENPHKYLLYKPTFSQLYTFLAASFKELPANSALLIYLSATGVFPTGRSDYEAFIQAISTLSLENLYLSLWILRTVWPTRISPIYLGSLWFASCRLQHIPRPCKITLSVEAYSPSSLIIHSWHSSSSLASPACAKDYGKSVKIMSEKSTGILLSC
ncbi:hypothetical protein XENTR_v10020521 [Xenopus tropicalis]|nr:hypothetical protein XENTR_v10020521 [Xenopus tropicalis]